MEITQFQEKHIEDAAKLFVFNLKSLRNELNELPDRLENIMSVESLLNNIINKNPSVVAISEDKLVGYLTGWSNIENFYGSTYGAYSPEWSHSTIPGNEKKEIYHNLYTTLSAIWVSSECHNHLFQFFANDTILKETFFSYCYGLQLIDAIRSIEPIKSILSDDIIVREASEDDLIDLQKMSIQIIEHLNNPPIFLNRSVEKKSLKEIKKEFLNNDAISFVAEKNGQIVSCVRGKLHDGNIETLKAKDTLAINFGYTYAEFRNNRIATEVLNGLLKWSASNNMARCTVDFESQNKEGMPFWLTHFKPVCFAVMRKIDDRIKIQS